MFGSVVKNIHIFMQCPTLFSPLKTKTLYPLKFPTVHSSYNSSNHHSTLCLCEFDYSTYLM